MRSRSRRGSDTSNSSINTLEDLSLAFKLTIAMGEEALGNESEQERFEDDIQDIPNECIDEILQEIQDIPNDEIAQDIPNEENIQAIPNERVEEIVQDFPNDDIVQDIPNEIDDSVQGIQM